MHVLSPFGSLTRDGRVFKPATHNALLDILLARGVNGESPSKRRRSLKSIVSIRRVGEEPPGERRRSVKGKSGGLEENGEEDVKGKGKATGAGRRKSVVPRKRKSVATKAQAVVDEAEGGDEQPVAGMVIFTDYMRMHVMVCYRPFPCCESSHEDDEAQERRYRN